MKISIIKLIISLYMINGLVSGISTGANEPIADNELGLMAKDCSRQYCEVKDGLQLWLTLVDECVANPNPYLLEMKNMKQRREEYINERERVKLVENFETFDVEKKYSPILSGYICSTVAFIGFYTGVILGRKERRLRDEL